MAQLGPGSVQQVFSSSQWGLDPASSPDLQALTPGSSWEASSSCLSPPRPSALAGSRGDSHRAFLLPEREISSSLLLSSKGFSHLIQVYASKLTFDCFLVTSFTPAHMVSSWICTHPKIFPLIVVKNTQHKIGHF